MTTQLAAPTNRAWTIDAIRALGSQTDIVTAGEILGIGRTKAYEMAREGEFPVKIYRVGRKWVASVPAILDFFARP
ncbi:DNA-binding protein [Hamadaea sp. NPDC051192]|uniref:helix-turn-helix domain-containing protein n=1 Tax=Hamadaea sp. NPDC051192 TaxID=3154940 RepID=UPI00343A4EEC